MTMNTKLFFIVCVISCLQQSPVLCKCKTKVERTASRELQEDLDKIAKNLARLHNKIQEDKKRQLRDRLLAEFHEREAIRLKERLEIEKNNKGTQQIVINQSAGLNGNNNAVLNFGRSVFSSREDDQNSREVEKVVNQKIEIEQETSNDAGTMKSSLKSESSVGRGPDGKPKVNVSNKQNAEVELRKLTDIQAAVNQNSDAKIVSHNTYGIDESLPDEVNIKHEKKETKEKVELQMRTSKMKTGNQ